MPGRIPRQGVQFTTYHDESNPAKTKNEEDKNKGSRRHRRDVGEAGEVEALDVLYFLEERGGKNGDILRLKGDNSVQLEKRRLGCETL